MREYLFVLIIAAVVTYLLTPLVRRGAIAMRAQHEPRARDVHKQPTPLLGGLAMYGGLVAGLLVAERLTYLGQAFPSSRTVNGLLAAGGLLVIVGIVDDRWGLGAISKLAGADRGGRHRGVVRRVPVLDPLAGRDDRSCSSRTSATR